MEVQSVKMYGGDGGNGTFSSKLFSHLFSDFDRFEKQEWMEKNWTMSVYGVCGYVLFIWLGGEAMKSRKPFDLRRVMAVWNLILSVFSISACLTVIPEFAQVLNSKHGFHKSVCASCSEVSDASVFWGWLFTLSKMMELGDTVFLILRKRKLIFLHWYHHITVLLYTWYSYSDQISPARWFIVVNFSIHALMYTYYCLRSLGVRVPRPIAMSITLLQLSQMFVGVGVNGYAYVAKLRGFDCDVSYSHLNMAVIMYGSYFALFAHFFYGAYFNNNNNNNTLKRKLKTT